MITRTKHIFLQMFAVVFIAFTIASAVLSLPAYAAEETNEVNTRQLPDSSFIYDTSITELAQADALMTKQTVQTKGEVVGDRIYADIQRQYCWITLTSMDANDDSSIAVYMTTASAQSIDTYGAYGKQGTILQVRGTFHLSCAEHEGLSDIHAESVTIVQEGVVQDNTIAPFKFLIAGAVVLVGLGLYGLYHLLQERRR